MRRRATTVGPLASQAVLRFPRRQDPAAGVGTPQRVRHRRPPTPRFRSLRLSLSVALDEHTALGTWGLQLGEVDGHQDCQQDDDRSVDRDQGNLPAMVGTMKSADAHKVGHNRCQAHWNPDRWTHSCAEADQWEYERNQNVGEAAAHPGDENRAGKCAFGRLVVVGCCEATRGGHVRHCLDGTRQGDR